MTCPVGLCATCREGKSIGTSRNSEEKTTTMETTMEGVPSKSKQTTRSVLSSCMAYGCTGSHCPKSDDRTDDYSFIAKMYCSNCNNKWSFCIDCTSSRICPMKTEKQIYQHIYTCHYQAMNNKSNVLCGKASASNNQIEAFPSTSTTSSTSSISTADGEDIRMVDNLPMKQKKHGHLQEDESMREDPASKKQTFDSLDAGIEGLLERTELHDKCILISMFVLMI
ncbi:hypothetical protein ACA910_000127 [Epithemia clementina (nom. ined.)]